MSGNVIIIVVLAVAGFASALAKVYVVHENRSAFTQLQQLYAERDEMNVEWGRLQIEQAAWSTHARIEQVAVQRLGMRTPDPARVVMVSK